MEFTKEKFFRAFFRTKKKVEESEFGSDRVFVSENGSLIVIDICDSNTICDEIHRIRQMVNDEELTIMLLKKYQVILKDIEESYEKVQKLLSPRFNVRDFCLSECTFFVDKDGTYSVELDYDFEEVLEVEVSRFIENDDEVLTFQESANSIVQDIVEGLEVS